MIYEEDKKLLQEISTTKNLNKNTISNYRSSIKQYTQCIGKSMTRLLIEAEKEEEQGIRWKKRKIRTHLIQYRAHLIDKYEYEGTIRVYLTKILAIYRHYEIELQPLPQVSTRNKTKTMVKYTDLPDKEIIRRALNIADPQTRAIILLISSTGMGRTETTNLRVQDFINATSEYHNKEDIYEVLQELDPNTDIIPTWQVHRQKTNKDYYTFSTPESTRAILYYLYDTRRDLTNKDSLFGIKPDYLGRKFRTINNRLRLGKVGAYNRFRPHMLRKYHASQLNQGKHKLSLDEVDVLQGRAKDSTRASYFLSNPSDLRRKYCLNMGELLILEAEKKGNDSELLELQRKYDELQANVKEAAREEVRRILLDLGYEL